MPTGVAGIVNEWCQRQEKASKMVRTYWYTYRTARMNEPIAVVDLNLPRFHPTEKRYTVPMPKVMPGIQHLEPEVVEPPPEQPEGGDDGDEGDNGNDGGDDDLGGNGNNGPPQVDEDPAPAPAPAPDQGAPQDSPAPGLVADPAPGPNPGN